MLPPLCPTPTSCTPPPRVNAPSTRTSPAPLMPHTMLSSLAHQAKELNNDERAALAKSGLWQAPSPSKLLPLPKKVRSTYLPLKRSIVYYY